MKKTKRIPSRICVGCQEAKDKPSLVRVVKDSENHLSLDTTGKKNGRGAYLCDSVSCLEKAIKAKRLERAFEMTIEDKIYEELRGVMIDKSE